MSRRVMMLGVAASIALLASIAPSAAASPSSLSSANRYRVVRLVSDQPGHARHLDPNLRNAWGLVAGPSTPWWVADNGTNVSTLYDGAGDVLPLVVDVPGAPTGAVFNGGSGFEVTSGADSGPAVFMFATESGTIRGWNPNVPSPPTSTSTEVVVDRSNAGAIFKGLAFARTASGGLLYATDFHNARVDVFDSSFTPVGKPGAFVDPSIPKGFAPFGIQNVHGVIVVTYAKQDADAEDDVSGPGLGFVDAYSAHGDLLARLVSRGRLNAPWGIALAPDGFGRFSGDLLIGNFGNGKINAYELNRDGDLLRFDAALHRRDGSPIVIDGLWALEFGNGGPAGPARRLFFTAGPDDESHGLFGSIRAT